MFIKKWHEKKTPNMNNLNFYIDNIIQIEKKKKNTPHKKIIIIHHVGIFFFFFLNDKFTLLDMCRFVMI